MSAFYNEFDAYPAQWIRNLAAAGLVASGVVDERSIKEVQPADVGDGQVHLFAGIAVWSHALRLAGWPDGFPVWSASCPCQPWSTAGKKQKRGGILGVSVNSKRARGFDDERHLWPEAFRLIAARRPVCVVGEQVASPDGLAWLDAVFADLEGTGYACRAFDLCAAGFGAPHIRQRLYWAAIRMADDGSEGRRQVSAHGGGSGEGSRAQGLDERLGDSSAIARGLGHADSQHAGRDTRASTGSEGGPGLRPVGDEPRAPSATDRLGDTNIAGLEGREVSAERAGERPAGGTPGPSNGHWSGVEWLPCRDGKLRPTQPGLFPLAHGATSRVGRLRAYGNAIVAPQAAEFLQALKPLVEHLWEEA